MNDITSLILITFHAIINLLGAALIKKQVNIDLGNIKSIFDYFKILLSLNGFLGLLLIGLGFLVSIKIYKQVNFSYFMPISLAVSYIISFAISYFFLEEKIEFRIILGSTIILIGIFFINK